MFKKIASHFFGNSSQSFFGNLAHQGVGKLADFAQSKTNNAGIQGLISKARDLGQDYIRKRTSASQPGMEGEQMYKRVPNPGGIDQRKAIGGETYRKSKKYKERFMQPQTTQQPTWWDRLKDTGGDVLKGLGETLLNGAKESIWELAAL
jgi:hypothetical protein